MRRFIGIVSALVALATIASAQEPTKGLEPFAKMVGQWEGSGKVYQGPDDKEGMDWTAVETTRWVLGKRFLESDMLVDFGEALPAPLAFRTLYGIDPAAQRPVAFGLSNMGVADPPEIQWADDKTFLSVARTIRPDDQGVMQPEVERTIVRFTEDGYTVHMESAMGTGAFHTYVSGNFKPSEREFAATHERANTPFFSEVHSDMDKLGSILGKYTMNGEIRMAAGDDPIAISARESLDAMFGGHVIVGHVQGDPIEGMPGPAYEAFGYVYWDPMKKCYGHLAINNMGEIHTADGYWLGDDTIAFTGSGLYLGQPSVNRTLLHLGEDGRIVSGSSDAMLGGGETFRSFEGTYGVDAGLGGKLIEARFTAGSCCARAVAAGKTCTHPCCVKAAAAGEVCSRCNS